MSEERQPFTDEDLVVLATDVVARARQLGADEADAYLLSGIESSVSVRRGEVERLIEAGSRSVSIRVIREKRTAVCNTSDFTPRALDALVQSAVELAKISEPDEFAGLPAKEDLASDYGAGLGLFDESIESLTVDEMKDVVLRAERAAFDFDARVTNSEGAEFAAERGQLVLANSLGFAGTFPYTAASFAVSVIADDADGKKRNDSWFSAERRLHRLESPEEVGRRAAARAVRKLGAVKVRTREAPVVWDPLMAARLARMVAAAASGEAMFKRATFLFGLEGEQVGSPLCTIIDDATLPGRLASRPFDGEGVTTRRHAVIDGGRFGAFLFDSYYGRRTGRRTTGSAARTGDSIGIGYGNLVWQPGATPAKEIIGGVPDGLYLTDLMGHSVNSVTGDLSLGAAGVWIEHGELTYPVTEINVSGNLKQMLRDVDAVGDDLLWMAGSAAPTVRVERMTVSGL
ncbi:MAG: TldD/PmbA family protein [Dehalococcoidia bacterium]|nr:TldD/PmbA family protein [Dehalococcoidia bacterium]